MGSAFNNCFIVSPNLRNRLAAILLSFSVLWAAVVSAGTNYVARTGVSSPYDGSSWAHAFTNVQDALNAGAGNVIYVKGETFPVTTALGWTSANIELRGGYAGSGTPGSLTNTLTVLQQNGSGQVLGLSGVNAALISRVSFVGGYLASGSGAGISVANSTGILIVDCVIANNGTGSNSSGAGFRGDNSSGVISNCVISANNASGGGYTYGGGMGLAGGGWTIVNTRIVRNNGSGNSSGGGGGFNIESGTHTFRNCIIAGNYAAYSGGPWAGGGRLYNGTVVFQNCNILLNGVYGLVREGGTVAVLNSILRDNGTDAVGTMTLSNCNVMVTSGVTLSGCQSGDPMFVRGLYLATNSPCLNAGSTDAGTAGMSGWTTQTNGTPDSGTVDIGYHMTNGLDTGVAELYVATTGNDNSGTGSSGSPFRTITRAVAAASYGTHVHVGAGQYTNGLETFPISLQKYGMQIIGAGADVTSIDGLSKTSSGMLSLVDCLGDSRIEGVSVVNGYVKTLYSNRGGGIAAVGSGVDILSCVVSNNYLECWEGSGYEGDLGGSVLGGGIGGYCSRIDVSNTVVRGNTASCGTRWGGSYGGGVAMQFGTLTLQDSDVLTNRLYGNGNVGGGIYLGQGRHIVKNALIARNNSVVGDGICVDSATLVAVNCTLADNAGQGLYRAGGTVTVTNSILWGNGMDATGTMSMAWCDIGVFDAAVTTNGFCISTNPLFVSAVNGDYHEMSRVGSWHDGTWASDAIASPCIDTGMPGCPYNREPQPNGNKINMGAYGNTAQASKTLLRATIIVIR